MQSYLSSRPKTFPTLEAGIEWQYVLLSCLELMCFSDPYIFLSRFPGLGIGQGANSPV